MKIAGIILIVAGVLMCAFDGINFQTEKKVVDIGPLEINKKETRHIGWPIYAGGIMVIAGIAAVALNGKKTA